MRGDQVVSVTSLVDRLTGDVLVAVTQ